jgi:hypothetical protein
LVLALRRHAKQHYVCPDTGRPTNELNDYRYSSARPGEVCILGDCDYAQPGS